MLNQLNPRTSLLVIFVVMFAAIAGAWIFEALGFAPCHLCLLQRWAYYIVVPFSLVLYLLAPSQPGLVKPGLVLLALVLAGSAVFGAYHSGIEWKWWPGPSTCVGTGAVSSGLPDLTKKVVLCDEAALRIFGLSLAGWNAVISAALCALALRAFRRV
jgi:disulfide bond formation protein DsbB